MTSWYENKKISHGYSHVIGCDEVGRGSLAGPVVAAAVVLNLGSDMKMFRGVQDSKVLKPGQREELDIVIRDNCLGWGIGVVGHSLIDKINIHQATLRAMKWAVQKLLGSYSSSLGDGSFEIKRKILVAVDGKFTIAGYDLDQEAVTDGDAKVLSIAAASIIAKVYRDKLMRQLHIRYPAYNFAQHKGYGTFHHREAIKEYGMSTIHRKSFCKKLLQSTPHSI